LIEALQAGIQFVIDFKDMMQLQQFEQFHYFGIHVANFELTVIVVCSFHD
jgi:hypothetical protein